MSEVGSPRAQRLRRTWSQRAVLGLHVCAVIAALSTAASLTYFNHQIEQVQRVEFGRDVLQTDVPSGEPQNYLIVGADSSARLPEEDFETRGRGGVDGVRSDTIMILRVEPGQTKAKLLSLPRDLWIPISGTGSKQRINTAINSGGPEVLVKTIQDYFKIPINHYLQIDFYGFKELVQAVGGVPVYFPEPVRDRGSGLNIPEAGCHVLDPDSALAFSRSRHYQAYRNGRWRSDPDSDLSRIKRQQFFIQRALTRAIDRGVRSPGTLKRLVELGVRNVVLDDDLRVKDLVDLGKRFKDFNPESLETYSVPVDDVVRGGAAVLDMRVDEAQSILNLFRDEEATETDPSGVRVRVLNGSGQPGQAADVTEDLLAEGFATELPGDAGSYSRDQTTIRYAPGKAAAAQLLARYLDVEVAYEEVSDEDEVDVTLVTAPDFTHVLDAPKDEKSVPPPSGSTPSSSAPVTDGSSSTTSVPSGSEPTTPTTPTTEADFVPDEPPPSGIDC